MGSVGTTEDLEAVTISVEGLRAFGTEVATIRNAVTIDVESIVTSGTEITIIGHAIAIGVDGVITATSADSRFDLRRIIRTAIGAIEDGVSIGITERGNAPGVGHRSIDLVRLGADPANRVLADVASRKRDGILRVGICDTAAEASTGAPAASGAASGSG